MRYSLASIALFLLVMLGCSDEPSGVGRWLISPQDTLRVDSLVAVATSDTTFLYRVNGSTHTLVGKFQDIDVRAAMQFTGFTSIPSTATIDSAIVKIPVNYAFRDSSGTLGFSVHEMLRSWSDLTFSWDSSQATGTFNTTPETTYNRSISLSDSFVTFNIVQLVRQWVQAGTDAPNGIILIPDAGSTIAVGSRSSITAETRPLLTVFYRDTTDSAFTFARYTSQRTFIANRPLFSPSQDVVVQAGIAQRSLLRFSSLTLPARVSITQATLELTFNSGASLLNSFTRDSLVVSLLRKSSLPYDSLTLSTLCTPKLNDQGQRVYQADIKAIVQLWTTGEPNHGLILRAYGEFFALDRFAIYGGSAAEALRPRLTIKYTVLP